MPRGDNLTRRDRAKGGRNSHSGGHKPQDQSAPLSELEETPEEVYHEISFSGSDFSEGEDTDVGQEDTMNQGRGSNLTEENRARGDS